MVTEIDSLAFLQSQQHIFHLLGWYSFDDRCRIETCNITRKHGGDGGEEFADLAVLVNLTEIVDIEFDDFAFDGIYSAQVFGIEVRTDSLRHAAYKHV